MSDDKKIGPGPVPTPIPPGGMSAILSEPEWFELATMADEIRRGVICSRCARELPRPTGEPTPCTRCPGSFPDLKPGTRVRFTEDTDRYPNFVIPAGTVGVVDECDREMKWMLIGFADDVAIAGLTDERGREEWQGQFQWTSDDEANRVYNIEKTGRDPGRPFEALDEEETR